MKILRFDSVGGASGDMTIASLIDLGVNLKTIKKDLGNLGGLRFQIKAKKISSNGLTGTQVIVKDLSKYHHHHRGLKDIVTILKKSRLPKKTTALAIAVFTRLAKAEALVHGTTVDHIHFHEVGAVDSIVDITAACHALTLLEVDAVIVGPLPAGTGTIRCAHGIMPCPAPATVQLLKNHLVTQTDEPFELVTPTGAALLMEWKRTITHIPPARLIESGTGFGQAQLKGRPNILRATLFETEAPPNSDTCVVLECNIDDTTPQIVGALTNSLLEQGALDAFVTPVFMKKQRPGMLLTLICKPTDKDKLANLIFAESPTFGLREYTVNRTTLERRFVSAKTRYGNVRIKIGTHNGKDITKTPEFDDCLKLAKKHNVAVRKVCEAANRAIR